MLFAGHMLFRKLSPARAGAQRQGSNLALPFQSFLSPTSPSLQQDLLIIATDQDVLIPSSCIKPHCRHEARSISLSRQRRRASQKAGIQVQSNRRPNISTHWRAERKRRILRHHRAVRTNDEQAANHRPPHLSAYLKTLPQHFRQLQQPP